MGACSLKPRIPMRLYHHPYSFNSRRAVMTALHLKAPVELVFVDLQKGEQQLVREYAGILDAHLSGREWICGDALSLADIAIAAPVASTVPAKLPVMELGHLQRWFGQVQQLEAWRKTALP